MGYKSSNVIKGIFYSKKGEKKVEESVQPNQDARPSIDRKIVAKSDFENMPLYSKVGISKLGTFNSNQPYIFKRNMTEKDVRREIFIIEGEDHFESLVLRSKMTLIIKKSSIEIKNWFFDLGSENLLPESWENFKDKIVEMCCNKDINSIYKYKEEKWSDYIIRLKYEAFKNRINENEIFQKLRKEN